MECVHGRYSGTGNGPGDRRTAEAYAGIPTGLIYGKREMIRTLFTGNSHTSRVVRDLIAMQIMNRQGLISSMGIMIISFCSMLPILWGVFCYGESGRWIKEWVKQTNSEVCLHMTWTKEGDEVSQPEILKRYRDIADKHGCMVAPVGEKRWEYILTHPEVDLFSKTEGMHLLKSLC